MKIKIEKTTLTALLVLILVTTAPVAQTVEIKNLKEDTRSLLEKGQEAKDNLEVIKKLTEKIEELNKLLESGDSGLTNEIVKICVGRTGKCLKTAIPRLTSASGLALDIYGEDSPDFEEMNKRELFISKEIIFRGNLEALFDLRVEEGVWYIAKKKER